MNGKHIKLAKKAVIFDLDGVIRCTNKFHCQVWNTLANRLGIYFDEKINDQFWSISCTVGLDIIFSDLLNILP